MAESWYPADDLAGDPPELIARERERGALFRTTGDVQQRLDGLDIASRAGLISASQASAGRKYGNDYNTFFNTGRYWSTLAIMDRPHWETVSDISLEAAHRLKAARAILSPAQIQLCDLVCGAGKILSVGLLQELVTPLNKLLAHYGALPKPEDDANLLAFSPLIFDLRREAEKALSVWANTNSLSHPVFRGVLSAAQGRRCAICDRAYGLSGASVDHVIARARGGFPGPGNILMAHVGCNNRKGAATPSHFELRVLARVNAVLGWGSVPEADPDEHGQRIIEALANLPTTHQVKADEPPAEPRFWPAVSNVRSLGMTAREWARRKIALERTLKRLQEMPAEAPPSAKKRFATPMPALAPAVAVEPDWSDLLPGKPSRDDDGMHTKWLQGAGVLKKNRDMRHLGVQAGAAAKRKRAAKGRKRPPRRRKRG